MLTERYTNCSPSLGIPDSNGIVPGPGEDMPPIGRERDGVDPLGMPYERHVDYSTGTCVPDPNRIGPGSGKDVAPIRRVSNGMHTGGLHKRVSNCDTSIGIPDLDVDTGPSNNVAAIRRTS